MMMRISTMMMSDHTAVLYTSMAFKDNSYKCQPLKLFILKAKNPQSRQYTYQFLVVMVHVAPLNYSKLWQTQGQTTLDIARQIVKYFKNYLKRDF